MLSLAVPLRALGQGDGSPTWGDCTKIICITISGIGALCLKVSWVCDD